MVLTNETVLIEQYTNNRGPGQGGRVRRQNPPEAETRLASGCSMEATNLRAF